MTDTPDTPATDVRADSSMIERCFQQYGWSFDRISDDTFRTGFRGKHAAFVALVRVTEHWVVFTINPYVKAPHNGFGVVALKLLASGNQQGNLIKLGIDDDGDAFMNVELPSEAFTYPQFQAAMTALAHFADTMLLQILQAVVVDERDIA
jgi:hypothetical protein